jgi:hypothetical protein
VSQAETNPNPTAKRNTNKPPMRVFSQILPKNIRIDFSPRIDAEELRSIQLNLTAAACVG